MNLYFLVFIIILGILYYIQYDIFVKINTLDKYTIGIVQNPIVENFTKQFISFLDNSISLKYYENSEALLKDVNMNKIDFCINSEANYIDSHFGLNSYKNNKLNNIHYITGLYYNYYYFFTNIFFKDTNKTTELTNPEDLKQFYSVYKRHLIIGTEDKNSDSFMGLLIVLYMYGFTPIDLKKKEKHKLYTDTTIFYITYEINSLTEAFINDSIDGIFLINTYNYEPVREVIDKKDVIFLDVTFNNTIFNDIYSSYFYKKNITISNNANDIDSTYTFETKASRMLLLANKNVDSNKVELLMKTYYKNNNILINSLQNKDNDQNEHTIFEPLDMIYVNKMIKIHKGAMSYMKELGFIINENIKNQLEINKNDHFNYYWKYDKIGLNKFDLLE